MKDPWERLRELFYDGDPNGVSWLGNETETDLVEVVRYWLEEVTQGNPFNAGRPREERQLGYMSGGFFYVAPSPTGTPHVRFNFGCTPWQKSGGTDAGDARNDES